MKKRVKSIGFALVLLVMIFQPGGTLGEPEGTEEEVEIIQEEALEEEIKEEEEAEIVEAEQEEEQEPQESQEDLTGSTIWPGTNVQQKDLKDRYHLTFSEDFSEVMKAIESDYRKEYKLPEEGDIVLKATNWQDIIAVYLLKKQQKGETELFLSGDDQEDLKRVYREMNRVVALEPARILYLSVKEEAVRFQSVSVEALIRQDQSLEQSVYKESEQEFLRAYSSEECRLLCAAETGIEEFLNQSEEEIDGKRQAVRKNAFQAIGKVSYIWGGKSDAIGLDSRWKDKNAFGLDCSGFVSWAFLNGVHENIGGGTTGQWMASVPVTQEEARPGDLVFLGPPTESDEIPHVGIVAGKDRLGGLIAIHCNASDKGVTVEAAYPAGFRYVRRPIIFQ